MRSPWLILLLGGVVCAACQGPADPAVPPTPKEPPMSAPHKRPRNRLARELSPYLRQHATNPVDWYPWGEEAFRKARAEDKPIFLSVGYSTCHWCHVMARESFENPEIAAILNAHFVPVKVDREERPDVDEIYMNVTQLLTGHGGWPNSVWLTPDGKPFFAGTYFPPEDRFGRPGFKTVLLALAREWRENRDAILARARQIEAALQEFTATDRLAPRGQLDRELLDQAVADLQRHFDATHGGFGTRPKFPPHGALAFLLYLVETDRREELLPLVTQTLDAMDRGGIHDHVGGGFHRYSTDEAWFLPHFEKMLYDNAQLARLYAEAFRLTGNPLYARTARRAYGWVLREMTAPEGGFYSALDAESEGVEGKFYLWRREEILAVLGPADGEAFCRLFSVRPEGNYREEASGAQPGTNLLALSRSWAEAAREAGVTLPAFLKRVDRWLEKLRTARAKRVRPHCDTKILTAWNGLMIGSLARGGKLLREPAYLQAAARAARFLLEHLRTPERRLWRSYHEGQAHIRGFLDDYVFLAEGLLDLYEATGEKSWLAEAEALMEVVEARFADPDGGGYYYVPDDHEKLLLRTKDAQDRAVPSGNGVAARVWLRLAAATGKEVYERRAERTLKAFLALMERWPRATETLLEAAARYLAATEQPQEAQEAPPDAAASAGPVAAAVFLTREILAPGSRATLLVRLRIEDGWHVTGPDPGAEHVLPLSLRVAGKGLRAAPPVWPPTATLRQGDTILQVYEGEIWVGVALQAAPDAAPGEHTLEVRLTLQACTATRCRAPETLTLAVRYRVDHSPGPVRHEALLDKLRGR